MLETALDDILATKAPRGCGFAQWIATLDDDDRDRLTALLYHPDVAADDIVEVLRQHFTISAGTVRRHRRWLTQGLSGCGCK